MSEPKYEPTREQIEREAAKIREGWDALRWRRERKESGVAAVQIPIIKDPRMNT